MTENIFTAILESYRKEEISEEKAKRQIRLLLYNKDTSDSKINTLTSSDVTREQTF
jgi:hypothetical protein